MLKDNLVKIYTIQKTHEVNEILTAFIFCKLEKMVTVKKLNQDFR
jgi:hypothetical protein